jgi:hypothetical protein
MLSRMRSYLIGFIAAGAVLGGIYWFYSARLPIVPYEASRDRTFIIDLFKKNWYWLINDYSPNYDVPFMLDHKTPPKSGHSWRRKAFDPYLCGWRKADWICCFLY